jgi:MFS transporter, PAT family, beta-lactamase induction signal transducer AmpG
MGAFFDAFRSKRVGIFIALGFAAGLPLQLRGPTLGMWMQDAGIDIKTITLFTAAGLFYTFKFIWAPLLDRYRLPWLGRRRGWMLLMQIVLLGVLAAIGLVNPRTALGVLALLSILTAFCSATQDIAIDAYKVDLLRPNERAAGSATYTMGYRLASIIGGGVALFLADHLSWNTVYLVLAFGMVVGLAGTWFGPEPETFAAPRSLGDAVVKPVQEFFSRRGAVVAVGVIMLYKVGEYLASDVTQLFLRERGFSKTEIAAVLKTFGMIATIVGVGLGGGLVPKIGVRRSLIIFGILQTLTNTGYIALAVLGQSRTLLVAAITIDWFIGGISTAAFAAYQMSICSKRFSATQFALIASASTVIGRLTAIWAGHIIHAVGWVTFFALTMVIAVPGLLLVMFGPIDRAMVKDERPAAPEPAAAASPPPAR